MVEVVLTEPVVTTPVVLVRLTEGAEEVVMVESDVVDDDVAAGSTENAVYDARIMTTTTATMIAVVFLAIAALKTRPLQFISYKKSAPQISPKTSRNGKTSCVPRRSKELSLG